MQAIFIRTFVILFLLAVINPSFLPAATEQRTALVIGNGAYSSGPLKNPVNDAADIATLLKKLGFSVALKKNVGLQEMEEAIESFGNQLKRGGVGLFYYAGHGVQVNGTNYLLPIGAKINKEADVKYQAVDANKILDEMATANNGLNIVMLDACRDNPFGRSFRNASRGLAIVSSAPSGTFISYSTSPGNVARDGDGRNSPYTAALLKYLQWPGLSISDVFINVRAKVKKETGQVPWELSSLEGQFYFMPGTAKTLTDELGDENKKLDAEQLRLEEEKAAFAKKKAIDEKRQKIAEEKERLEAEKEEARHAELERKQAKKTTTIAMAKRPSYGETGRDGRFIAYDNGTVLDTSTNLMWAAKDNESNINWQGAKSYCENYRGGGYSDWRMPTQDELAGLYDAGKSRPVACYTASQIQIHIATKLIDITCFAPWASETRGSEAAFFDFYTGVRLWGPQSGGGDGRALPVRSAK
jgi:hypothetical protein